MKPTYEELEAKLALTEANLAKALNLLNLALERIAVLEEQINKNSKNSSKPPSSDHKKNSSNKDKGSRKFRSIPSSEKTNFSQRLRTKPVGASFGTLRDWLAFIALMISTASRTSLNAGFAFSCKISNKAGPYRRI